MDYHAEIFRKEEDKGVHHRLERGKTAHIGIPKRRFFAQAHGLFGRGRHLPNVRVYATHELLFGATLQLGEVALRNALTVPKEGRNIPQC